MAEILLIDDDRHIAEVVEYVLKENGFNFSHAADARRWYCSISSSREFPVSIFSVDSGNWPPRCR